MEVMEVREPSLRRLPPAFPQRNPQRVHDEGAQAV